MAAGTILHGQSEGGNRPRLGATPGRHDAVRLSRPPVRRQEYASSGAPGIYRIAHLFFAGDRRERSSRAAASEPEGSRPEIGGVSRPGGQAHLSACVKLHILVGSRVRSTGGVHRLKGLACSLFLADGTTKSW